MCCYFSVPKYNSIAPTGNFYFVFVYVVNSLLFLESRDFYDYISDILLKYECTVIWLCIIIIFFSLFSLHQLLKEAVVDQEFRSKKF